MRYEDVLRQAVEVLNKKIGEGIIIRGADEDSDEYDDNSEQITWIAEDILGGLSDAEVLSLTVEAPNLMVMEPDFECGNTSPMGVLRENVYELLLDDVWEAFEGEEDANEEK